MTNYRRVTKMDRLAIFQGLQAGLTQKSIAAKLGLHPSTISREVKRNSEYKKEEKRSFILSRNCSG